MHSELQTPILQLQSAAVLIAARLSDLKSKMEGCNEDVKINIQTGKILFSDTYTKNPHVTAGLKELNEVWDIFETHFKPHGGKDYAKQIVDQHLGKFLSSAPFSQFCRQATSIGGAAVIGQLLRPEILLAGASNFEGAEYADGNITLNRFGGLLHWFLTKSTPAAVAHRKRAEIIKKMLGDAQIQKPNALFYGCGEGYEIEGFRDRKPASITVVNGEPTSLLSAKNAAEGVSDVVIEKLVRPANFVFGKVKDLPKADLTVSLGMIDYSPKSPTSDLARDVLKLLFDQTNPGGLIICSFITDRNPHQAALNTMLRWPLVHRTREEILNLIYSIDPNLKYQPKSVSLGQIPILSPNDFELIPVDDKSVNLLLIARRGS